VWAQEARPLRGRANARQRNAKKAVGAVPEKFHRFIAAKEISMGIKRVYVTQGSLVLPMAVDWGRAVEFARRNNRDIDD
jgi:hypothetical protein